MWPVMDFWRAVLVSQPNLSLEWISHPLLPRALTLIPSFWKILLLLPSSLLPTGMFYLLRLFFRTSLVSPKDCLKVLAPYLSFALPFLSKSIYELVQTILDGIPVAWFPRLTDLNHLWWLLHLQLPVCEKFPTTRRTGDLGFLGQARERYKVLATIHVMKASAYHRSYLVVKAWSSIPIGTPICSLFLSPVR